MKASSRFTVHGSRSRPAPSSFTLIELLAVVGIIVLIAGLVIGTASYSNRKARESKTKSQLHQLTIALDLYKNDWGWYPITFSNAPRDRAISHVWDAGTTNNNIDLYRALTNYTYQGGRSQYLEMKSEMIKTIGTTNLFVDPYGNPWGYFNPTNNSPFRTNMFNPRSYDLWSYGVDAADPTNALICNWRQQ